MTTYDSPLTVRDAVTITSRVLCGVALLYAVVNLFELPSYVMSLMHYQTHAEGVSSGNYYGYWASKYVGWIGGALLKAAIYLWAAKALYRCGPRVGKFLIGEETALDTNEGPRI